MNDFFKYEKEIYCDDTKETCFGYDEYLKSKHWKNLRTRLIGNNQICAICKQHKSAIQLHHLNYDRLGHELDSDLAVLCPNCHKLVHEAKNQQYKKPKGKKRKGKKKSGKKFCRNCRSYGYDRKLHQHYCLYHCVHVTKDQRGCPNYSTLRYASWCRKKPF